mmetsp:Transcript_17794/g.30664  ORF Transcript_17794/g.30664 Transcript_17794/m.30664 type:complete len:283 (+) Transcript_17794:77-925(+)
MQPNRCLLSSALSFRETACMRSLYRQISSTRMAYLATLTTTNHTQKSSLYGSCLKMPSVYSNMSSTNSIYASLAPSGFALKALCAQRTQNFEIAMSRIPQLNNHGNFPNSTQMTMPPDHGSGFAKPSSKDPNFYPNVGKAVETLQSELPVFFDQGLTYNIYTEDIKFCDGNSCMKGLNMYKAFMWALRIHGRVVFQDCCMDIHRIHQPDDHTISVRWTIRGHYRLTDNHNPPKHMDGISVYKINSAGLIYEHHVEDIMAITKYLEPLQRMWSLAAEPRIAIT